MTLVTYSFDTPSVVRVSSNATRSKKQCKECAPFFQKNDYYPTDVFDDEYFYVFTMLRDDPEEYKCFFNIQACKNGISFASWVFIAGAAFYCLFFFWFPFNFENKFTYLFFFFLENIDSVRNGVIIDNGGLLDNEYGFGIYIFNKKLVFRYQTPSCEFEYSRDVLLSQWFHVHMAYEERSLGFRIRLNSIIVYHESICKPRFPGPSRKYSTKISIGYRAYKHVYYNKFSIYGQYLKSIGEVNIDNNTFFLGHLGHTDAFSLLFNSFDRNDSNGYIQSKVGGLMNIDENFFPVQLKMYENVSLGFGSIYFTHYLDIIDGYVKSEPFYRNCFTHPQYCAYSYHLISFWLRLLSNANGTHFWMGNGNFTFIKVSNQDENIRVTVNSNKQTCTSIFPTIIKKWMLLMIQIRVRERGEEVNWVESKILIHGKEKPLNCLPKDHFWNIDDENGFIVFGGDYSTGSITEKGRSNIDDLYLYFDGNKEQDDYGVPISVYGSF